jgi:ribosome-associated toxin RatA of RatAB toxin-antitoxin module
MRTVVIEARLRAAGNNGDADAVFARIKNFAEYADYTDAVREVTVVPSEDGVVDSSWSVNFRNGILCWSERDWIDDEKRAISFVQLTGDFDRFEGGWQVTETGADVTVQFTATFDLGLASLAAMIDPIAERTLRENMHAIIRGLLGAEVTFPSPITDISSGSGTDTGA